MRGEVGDFAGQAVETGVACFFQGEAARATSAMEPVKVSVPAARMVLVLQLMICRKVITEVPIRLPLYCTVKPVVVQRRTNGAPLAAHVVVPGSVIVNVPET
jgi:hypothetical protein